MTFYIVHSTTRELVRRSNAPFNIDEAIQPPAPYLQLKRVDDDTLPDFNPATERLVRSFTDNDTLFTRTFFWQVTAMTQAEMDAYQQQQQDTATLEIIRNVYSDLKNGVGTNIERLVRVERAVAWLLRGSVR
jgi:hypothetical protein